MQVIATLTNTYRNKILLRKRFLSLQPWLRTSFLVIYNQVWSTVSLCKRSLLFSWRVMQPSTDHYHIRFMWFMTVDCYSASFLPTPRVFVMLVRFVQVDAIISGSHEDLPNLYSMGTLSATLLLRDDLLWTAWYSQFFHKGNRSCLMLVSFLIRTLTVNFVMTST